MMEGGASWPPSLLSLPAVEAEARMRAALVSTAWITHPLVITLDLGDIRIVGSNLLKFIPQPLRLVHKITLLNSTILVIQGLL